MDRGEVLEFLSLSLPGPRTYLPWLSFLNQARTKSTARDCDCFFNPIPALQIGITWKHVNGRSPDYFLPETTGAGLAFFDYHNHGWIDIFLLNKGPLHLYNPTP